LVEIPAEEFKINCSVKRIVYSEGIGETGIASSEEGSVTSEWR